MLEGLKGKAILSKIWRDVNENNNNCIIAVVGKPGSGKSHQCLRMAELLQPDFDASKQVCFSTIEFLKMLDSGTLRKGDVLIIEEGGILIENRNFMSQENRNMSFVFESFRNLNLVLFINVPNKEMVDKNPNRLFTWLFESLGYDKDKGISWIKPFLVKGSIHTSKIYNNYPYCLVPVIDKLTGLKWNNRMQIKRLIVNKPTQKTIDIYEARMTEFKKSVISKALKIVLGSEKINDDSNQPGEKKLTKIEQIVSQVLEKKSKYINLGKASRELIMYNFEIPERMAIAVKQTVEKVLQDEKARQSVQI